jgi:1-acyl-sn-glycerol-3-phosphate acyltransferase
VGTGLSFSVFGIAGLLLAVVVFPVMRLVVRDPGERELRSQNLVHWTFRLFVGLMQALGVVVVDVLHEERLAQPGQLVVANHPTLIDIVVLVSLLPQADCVVKKEAWSNPFMRSVITATGYLPNDHGDALVETCAERLRAGRTLVLFPEGTRSPEGGLGPFRRGFAHVALASQRPLRTVVIRADPPALMRGQPWYDVPERRLRLSVDCGAVLDPAPLVADAPTRGAAVRKVSSALRDFYAKTLQTQGP